MTQKIHGIIHGKTIELEENPGLTDGQEVEILLRVRECENPESEGNSGGRESSAGMMANYTERDTEILREIQLDRKRSTRRELNE